MNLKIFKYKRRETGSISCTLCKRHTALYVFAENWDEADKTMQDVGGYCAHCILKEFEIGINTERDPKNI